MRGRGHEGATGLLRPRTSAGRGAVRPPGPHSCYLCLRGLCPFLFWKWSRCPFVSLMASSDSEQHMLFHKPGPAGERPGSRPRASARLTTSASGGPESSPCGTGASLLPGPQSSRGLGTAGPQGACSDIPANRQSSAPWPLPRPGPQPRPLPGPRSPVHVRAYLPSCLFSRRPGAERLRSKGLRQAVTLAAASLVKSRSLQRCLRERRGRGRGPRSHHPSFIHRVTELLQGPRVGLWEADDTRYADPHWRAAARAGPRTLSAREGHCPLRDVAPRHSLWVEAVHRPRVPADREPTLGGVSHSSSDTEL